MATKWFTVLRNPSWGARGTFHWTVWQEGRQFLRASLIASRKGLTLWRYLFSDIFESSHSQNSPLCLQGSRTRFKRGARSRGKPGWLKPCQLEQCEHGRGKQRMLKKQSLKAFCHGCVDERFKKAKYQTINTIHNKVFPSLCSSWNKKRPANSGIVHLVHIRERWDSCGLRRKKGSPLHRCSHLSLAFLLETEGSPFAQPGLFPESLKEDFLSLIPAVCTDNSSAEIYQHRGTWLRLSGSRIEYCRCDSGRSRCHTVPVRGMYDKEKGNAERLSI